MYKTTIGIECHVQLKTKTKLFSAVGNDAREATPNTLISHIDLGMPGALPVLNEKALELGIRAGFALGTEPQYFSKFDRKHYFYPDLPMGYQITQFYNPIIRGGEVNITVDGQPKKIRIHEAHLEADAGKSTHPIGKDYSLVDLNRAGTPLLEIVSEPDMHSSIEAKTYAKELWLLMRYARVSEASLYYGNMRFDVNVSLSKTDVLGTRTETKNLNSFKAVEKAIEYEVKRQASIMNKGGKINQETLGWDESKQKTYSMRSKEEAHDYRYMPEPDIPPIELTEAMIKPIRDSMPVMPDEWRKRLIGLGMDQSQTDTLLEAEVDGEASYLGIIESNLANSEKAKALANWFVNTEIPLGLKADNKLRVKLYDSVYDLVKAGKLSSTGSKALIVKLLPEGKLPENLEVYAQEKGYIQVSDTGTIEKIVAGVLDANPGAAEDIKNGEMKAIGFLVGQVMKESKGQANPQLAQELIIKQLGL
ncbi:MAG: Asp-tRNA(Asn)/Glu-tRNA(Gln) amidotransferase subunit GatB [Candidatus Saccharibacteria bacterium]